MWLQNDELKSGYSFLCCGEPSVAVLWAQSFWWGVQVKFPAAGAGHVWILKILKGLNKSAIGVHMHACKQKYVDEM